VGTDTTAVLIDAGLSGKRTSEALASLGHELADVDGICLTHEHSDHTAGLRVLHNRHGIPLYANAGTIQGLQSKKTFKDLQWNVFTTGTGFSIGDIEFAPFSVPHDAYDPVGYIVSTETVRACIVTDMGRATALIRERISECDVLVIESNHDEQLLEASHRPWHLKQRIKGRQGHLSNSQAAVLAAEVCGSQLQHVFLAHLSSDCNEESLALRTMREALAQVERKHVRVSCTFANRPSEIWNSADVAHDNS